MGVIPETATEMEVARALLEAASIRMSRDNIPTISVISTCVNNNNNNDNNNNQEEKTKVENLECPPPDGNPRLKQNNEEILTVKDYWRERSGRRTTLPSLLSSPAFGTSELEDAPRSRSNTWGSEAKRILAPLVKAASSKDVEEAMAGGLSRTDIFIPPL